MSPHASSPHGAMPARPRPSTDQGIQPPRTAPPDESDALPADPEALDIWNMTPLAAAKLLTGFVETLIQKNAAEAETDASDLSTVKEAVREVEAEIDHKSEQEAQRRRGHLRADSKHHEDVPETHKTPIGSPELHPSDPGECSINGRTLSQSPPKPQPRQDDDVDKKNVLARKFAGKAAPPIALLEYVQRLHTYCPMSTAVYLAAGVYLERLVEGRVGRDPQDLMNGLKSKEDNGDSSPGASTDVESVGETTEFRLHIHRRNSHRLLLGALRVATKLLEDLSYAHSRFARVGGITERELTRLEVNFVFLAEFHLLVGEGEMAGAAKRMRRAAIEG